jgi:hypothetical protein
MQDISVYVIFDKRIAWRLHIEVIEAKASRTCIRIYSLLKSDLLSVNTKLNLHTALIRPVLTYACPAWELAADTYLSAPLETFQGTHRSTIWTQLSTFPLYTII